MAVWTDTLHTKDIYIHAEEWPSNLLRMFTNTTPFEVSIILHDNRGNFLELTAFEADECRVHLVTVPPRDIDDLGNSDIDIETALKLSPRERPPV